MTWRTWVTDLQTGQLDYLLDIPQFSWSCSVQDSTLVTTPDHGGGDLFNGTASGITIPVNAFPDVKSVHDRFQMIEPGRKALALFWQTEEHALQGSPGIPVLWGAIDTPEATPTDVSFALNSIYQLMSERFMVREGQFKNGTSTNKIVWKSMSKRGLASEAGRFVCSKPGGQLPIDWSYLGEKGGYELTISAWNIANGTAQWWFDKLSSGEDGVDMQWRPYLDSTGSFVRSKFVAASDHDHYLGANGKHRFSWTPQGGTAENVTVSFMKPIQRSYATGSGSDAKTLTAFAENLGLINKDIGYSLSEASISDTDIDKAKDLQSLAKGQLAANVKPTMQISFDWFLDDRGVPPLGSFWPGEDMELTVSSHPWLPDGIYKLRANTFSGDTTGKVHVTTDIAATPFA